MSKGHRAQGKPEAAVTRILGQGDTPDLLAKPVKVNTSHGVGYGAGTSVWGDTVFIDQRLNAEISSGAVAVKGLAASDIITEFVEHEHIEQSVDAGDNPVDSYQAAHAFAETAGHRVIKDKIDPDTYEKAIRPALDRCVARDPANAPKTLWCGPYLDIAFGDDGKDGRRAKEILRAYRDQGVEDAFKTSKVELHYGISDVECRDCKYYGGAKVNTCAIVFGLVRADRSCDRFEEK